MMQKNYNINEVAKLFNITTNKIRFYEKKGLLKPLREDGKIIIGDLMFKNEGDNKNILRNLSKEQIEEVNCEYYSYVNVLQDEFKKYNKTLSYTKIDDLNYIIMVQ